MSARVEAAVTPSVLKWARQTINYKLDEVAGVLKRKRVTSSTIEAWESGEARPTYAQLKKLAEIYKRPVVLFFYPEPPPEETPEVQMRSLPEAYTDEIPPKMRFLIRKAVIRQLDLAEIYGGNMPEEYQAFKLDTERIRSEIEERDDYSVAYRIRQLLGISLEEQRSWRDVDQALKRWRKAVEDVGIWVFKESFGEELSEKYSGFSLADEKFPIIYLNNNMPKSRQIFTLFHELGHLLNHTGGIAFRKDISDELSNQYKSGEVFCNAFAGELLIPRRTLIEPSINTPGDKEISRVAREYNVSRYVILRMA